MATSTMFSMYPKEYFSVPSSTPTANTVMGIMACKR